MKQKTRSKEDEDVFEFRDEDNPEDCRWSKIFSKIDNPISHDDDSTAKYQFLQNFSSGPTAQIKNVPIITLDDSDEDDRYSTDDRSVRPLDSPHKAGCELSDGFYSMSGRFVDQCYDFTDSSVYKKTLPPCMQTRVSTQLGPLPENSHNSSKTPKLPCYDGNDIVDESCPSATDSELEKNNDPVVGLAYGQSIDSEMMEVMDTIVFPADYVAVRDQYFPASLILISRDSVKVEVSGWEDESAASSFEWKAENILKVETQLSSLANVAKVKILLLTKAAAHAESANRTPGTQMLEFLVPNWSQQQERIRSFDFSTEFFNGDATLLEDIQCSWGSFFPSFEEPFEEVVYPKGEIDAVSVRKSDVDLLRPGVFLNDTIIDFYITFLKNGLPREQRNSFHFFSSFFFRKLADLDKAHWSVSDGKAAFQRVRRWTRKVNIFEKDYVFIPVNYNLHWSLIVLCHPGEVANFNVEHIDEALKVPCILHMDSIRGSHTGLKDLLQSYLMEEWKERKRETSEDISTKFLNLPFLSLELPQQENCSDCGLFLLHYTELFVDEAPLNFSPYRVNKFDHFDYDGFNRIMDSPRWLWELKQDWFVPAEASLKRARIQRRIRNLLKTRSHESVSPVKNTSSHSPSLAVNKEDNDGVQIVSAKRVSEKSLNEGPLWLKSTRDMDIDMPIRSPSIRADNSGEGTTELHVSCQPCNRGESLEQQGISPASIREVVGDEPRTHSNLGQSGFQSINRLRESYIDQGYASASGDSEELTEKYRNHEQVAPSFSNQDEVVVSSDDENCIVEESPPDQLRTGKRFRVTPSRGEVHNLYELNS